MTSPAQEHADHVFGAQFDDVRERYASELEDLKACGWADEDEMKYRQTVYESGFGDDIDAYESSWKRTFAYAQSGAVDNVQFSFNHSLK
tara:strand:+ start:105 stop:371 length:267 start_codon:yes stop_codon:yes gene_type:complete